MITNNPKIIISYNSVQKVVENKTKQKNKESNCPA